MTLHLFFPENEAALAVADSGHVKFHRRVDAALTVLHKDQLRASTLIRHLLDAELHYALSSNTILLTFKSEAAAEWCVGVLTAGDLL